MLLRPLPTLALTLGLALLAPLVPAAPLHAEDTAGKGGRPGRRLSTS